MSTDIIVIDDVIIVTVITISIVWLSASCGYIQGESKKSLPEVLSQFFQNGWEFFDQILHAYYAFISTLDYKFLFNYLQLWQSDAILSATTQRAFRSMVDILSTLWWLRLIWHNFVKVAGNWIKLCSPGTYNRHVKFGLKISSRLGKMSENFRGGDFFTHTVKWPKFEIIAQSTSVYAVMWIWWMKGK